MKIFSIILILLILLIIGGYFFLEEPFGGFGIQDSNNQTITENNLDQKQEVAQEQEEQTEQMQKNEKETVIGTSVSGREIKAYHFGSGAKEVLFIGGIHGAYAWNTALLAYEIMDYLDKDLVVIPSNVRITIIPVLNPDGLNKIIKTDVDSKFSAQDIPTAQTDTVPGRFNANSVDLNRNFDCDWQEKGIWQNKAVSGGSEPFSEPESKAIKQYIETKSPSAVVVWYSASGGVFASSCHNGVLPETLQIMNIYAKSSGYKSYKEFNFYEITGDMVNWVAKNNIPAISVLLTTHKDVEFEKNLAGLKALMEYYKE